MRHLPLLLFLGTPLIGYAAPMSDPPDEKTDASEAPTPAAAEQDNASAASPPSPPAPPHTPETSAPSPEPELRGPPSPEPPPGVDGARFDSLEDCRSFMASQVKGLQGVTIRRFDARHRRCTLERRAWVYRDTHGHLTLDPILDPALLIASGVTLALSRNISAARRGADRWSLECDADNPDCATRRDPLARGLTRPVPGWREASDAILYASTALSMSPLLTSRGNARLTDTIVMTEVMLLNLAVTESIKVRVAEPRPYTAVDLRAFPSEAAWDLAPDLRGDDAWKSYFSGHTSITAASSFGLATLWATRQRGTRPGWYVLPYGLAAGLTAVQGTARVLSLKHDPMDVTVGAISGALIGTLVPLAHSAIANVIDPERPRRRGQRGAKLALAPQAGIQSVGIQGAW